MPLQTDHKQVSMSSEDSVILATRLRAVAKVEQLADQTRLTSDLEFLERIIQVASELQTQFYLQKTTQKGNGGQRKVPETHRAHTTPTNDQVGHCSTSHSVAKARKTSETQNDRDTDEIQVLSSKNMHDVEDEKSPKQRSRFSKLWTILKGADNGTSGSTIQYKKQAKRAEKQVRKIEDQMDVFIWRRKLKRSQQAQLNDLNLKLIQARQEEARCKHILHSQRKPSIKVAHGKARVCRRVSSQTFKTKPREPNPWSFKTRHLLDRHVENSKLPQPTVLECFSQNVALHTY